MIVLIVVGVFTAIFFCALNPAGVEEFFEDLYRKMTRHWKD